MPQLRHHPFSAGIVCGAAIVLRARERRAERAPRPQAGLVEGLGRSDTEADTPLAARRRWADQLWRAPCAVGQV